jgi:fructokinase
VRIGIDWGGTKIEAIALSDAGAVLARKRIATPQHDYDACIAAAVGLVREIKAALGKTGTLGIGIPGAISPVTGLVKNANSVWLNGRSLDRDMAQALGRSVRVENDANCLAVSESVDGAGSGSEVVWAVILGTGAGSGIAVNGRPPVGRHRIAGEWGHNPLPWPREEITSTGRTLSPL